MKINILILLSIIFCGSGCEELVDHVYSIKIQNSAIDTIQFYASYTYPDTSIISEKPSLKMVYPSEFIYLDSKKKWEEALPKDTIIIFILSKDTVDTYTWETIRDDYNILKRFDRSIKDLENNQWTITYP